ncbi:MAG: hypothetical protein AAGD11_15795 [Planctomycetota bacterium]
MPRFVLLRHECPPSFGKPSHWDFMLEWGNRLRTWELRELPQGWARALGVDGDASTVAARALPDHRAIYLDYEGPLTGDRGSVRRSDAGTYEILVESGSTLKIALEGRHWCGVLQLSGSESAWTITTINA